MSSKRLATVIAVAISILIFPVLIDQTAQLPLGPDGFVIVPGERWATVNDSGVIVGFSAVDEASDRSGPVDSAGRAIEYRYDSMGNLTSVSSDSPSSTVYMSDSAVSLRTDIRIDGTDPVISIGQGDYGNRLGAATTSAAPMIARNQAFQWSAAQTLTVSRAGWYDLSTYSDVCGSINCRLEVIWLPLPDAAINGQSELTSEARSSWTTVLTTEGQKTSKDGSAAWVHLDGPGTLVVTLATADARQADYTLGLHALSWGELIARMRNLSFVGVLVSMYLFRWAAVSCLWILFLVLLHRFTFWVLCQLPARQRGAARKEIEGLLWVAKWGGLASYALWTIIDIAQFVRG